ncbi:arylacetamide deacetylase-like 4 isoform X2 [Rhineura floridana]|uniref:arylacetamide deacetylase-like 4 isoform X2 n=1 Tax=Rhineura floridana TaxID=261503 RepID=UPI002AC843F9|nr:arylacetamide deacetylase-like 4 isoform X2 [Rhineura floridana]
MLPFLAQRAALGEALLNLLLYLSIFIPFLALAWTLYYHVTRTHIPPGISQGAKLHVMTLFGNLMFGLALFLEKVGICHKYVIWRLVMNGILPREDSKLIIKDLLFDGIPVRIYWPKASPARNGRGMLYLHGGAGLFGSIRAYERVCRYIARESDTVVVSVEFRLAPEHRHPVPLLDCCTAAIHFLKNAKEYGVDPNRIAIGGDSSGGTFAAVVCQELVTRVDLPRMRAQIMVYPFLQAVDFNLPSHQQNRSVPMLFRKRAIQFGFAYLTGKTINVEGILENAHVPRDMWVKYRKWISADNLPEEFKARGYVSKVPVSFSQKLYELVKPAFDPRFSPLLAEDAIICQLPETFILTCEHDVLRDDGLLYKKRLEDNGVPVTWHHVQDGFHGVAIFIDYVLLEFPGTRDCMEHVAQFLKGL